MANEQVRLNNLWQLIYERENSYFKPPLSCGIIPLWKRLQEISSRTNQEWILKRLFDVKLWPLSGSSHRGRKSLQIKPVWRPRAGGSRQTWSPAGRCNYPLSRSSQTLLYHRISVEVQVSGLCTVHPLPPYVSSTYCFFLLSKCCHRKRQDSMRREFEIP